MSDKWQLIQSSAIHTRLLTKETPAVAAHGGYLWCAWVDSATGMVLTARFEVEMIQVLFAVPSLPKPIGWTGDTKVTGPPALAEMDNELHLVVRSSTGHLVHYRYDDTKQTWGKRTHVDIRGKYHHMASYENQLYCISIDDDGSTYWGTWSSQNYWSDFKQMDELKRKGGASLFTWAGKLYFASLSFDSNQLLESKFLATNTRWEASDDIQTRSFQDQNDGVIGIALCEGLKAIHLALLRSSSPQFTIWNRDAERWNLESENVMYNTSAAPALVFVANMIYCVWAASSPGELYLAQRDATPWGELRSWMSHLDPNTPITEVNIPGTHDACTANDWFPRVTCQRMTIARQLNSGIRYLDIRGGMARQLSPDGNNYVRVLAAYHGPIAIGSEAARLQLSDVLNTCYTFLEQNPTEGLILQVKRDSGDETEFVNQFVALIKQEPGKWLQDSDVEGQSTLPSSPFATGRMPTVKQLAGKILLVRRFRYQTHLGIDATAWPANTTGTIRADKVMMHVQDNFNIMDSSVTRPDIVKFEFVRKHLDTAYHGLGREWFINYTSAVYLWATRGSTKLALNNEGVEGMIVNGVNGLLLSYLKSIKEGRFGTVVMDFADSPPQLIAALISTNRFAKP